MGYVDRMKIVDGFGNICDYWCCFYKIEVLDWIVILWFGVINFYWLYIFVDFYIELIIKYDKIEKKINEIVFEFIVIVCIYM